MKVLLFDHAAIRQQLLPLTYTRPVGDLRIGILTIAEKWSAWLNASHGFATQDYLKDRFPAVDTPYWINGAACPDTSLIDAFTSLKKGQGLFRENILIAAHSPSQDWSADQADALEKIDYHSPVTLIDRPWKIFQLNASELKKDFNLLTKDRISADVTDKHTVVYGRENLFIEEGVSIRAAIIDAEKGPVYLGKNSSVMEGAIIKGAFALGEGGIVSMGAKLRGDSSIGPFCKIGGEVSNTVMHSYSNKSHDGFLGNAVIGQWCNMGAGTNSSNMKNNYTPVKIYDYHAGQFIETGSIFCGLIMGDHSKAAINTMFNTATVVGVSANIFGAGFPQQFIPSFAWGGADGFSTFKIDKALETAEAMMARRDIAMDQMEKDLLTRLFEESQSQRTWENN
jgi:UDP-N-acetylglucosamine diphosphorylase/glucosamine-1-phosphate N-acetyltransferase